MRKADADGPLCPATGRTIAEDLHAAVHLLSTVPPYRRNDVRYNDQEWRAYCDGYYRAIAQVGAVMDLAMARRRTRVKESHAEHAGAALRAVASSRAQSVDRRGTRRAGTRRRRQRAAVRTGSSRRGHRNG